jgi:hypothetical protein
MSNQFLKLRRSAVPGRIPTTSSLDFGEIALNTYDGLAFMKKSGSSGEQIVTLGTGTGGGSITGSQFFLPVFNSTSSLITSSIYQSGSFTSIGATSSLFPNALETLLVNSRTNSYNLISGHANIDNYVQLNIKNFSGGPSASADIVATADTGNEESNYINMGINGSNYTAGNAIGGALDAYLYNTGENLYIGNTAQSKQIVFFNGGFDVNANAALFIHDQGTITINTAYYNTTFPPSLGIQAPNSTTNTLIEAVGNTDQFLQLAISNENNGSFASSDIVAYNNLDPTNQAFGFIDMGINSTNFNDPINYPGWIGGHSYLFSDAPGMVIGSTSGSSQVNIFAGGNNPITNSKLLIRANNIHSLTGSLQVTGSITGSSDFLISGITVGRGNSSIGIATNTVVGNGAFISNTAGHTSVAIGLGSLRNNTTGYRNFVIGVNSLYYNTTGAENLAMSAFSLQNNTIGNGNIAIGLYSTFANIAGNYNVGLGNYTNYEVSDGSYNTSIGHNTGRGVVTGNYNTVLGAQVTGLSASLSNNIIIADGQGNIKYRWDATQNNIYGNLAVTGSVTATTGFTGSLEGTASWAQNALSASYWSGSVLNATSASFASTASSADNFTVRGTLTAQTIVAQTITSSTDFVTGSTRFGSLLSNTHQFTGSVSITGSLAVNGSNVILSNQTGSMSVATASYILNAVSASYAATASYVPASGVIGLNLSQISTGSVTASVNTGTNIFNIVSGSNTLVVVDNAGSVGIGITSPTTKLDVNGSISAKMPSYNSTGFQILNADGVQDWSFYNNGNSPTNGRPFLLVPRWSSGTPIQISAINQNNSGVNDAILIGGSASGATLSDKSIRIGKNAGGSVGVGSIIIGTGRASGIYSISISSDQYGIAVGNVLNDRTFLIGSSVEATTTNNNQGVLNAIDVYVGRPARSSSLSGDISQGLATSINGMGGYGQTDATGGSLTINGGVGLGAGASGDIIFGTATPTSTGTTLQTLSNRVWIKGQTGNVGIGVSPDAAYKLDVSGSTRLNGNAQITGSLTITQGITGSLFGTSSWAQNAVTSSYILNAVSSSFASTASYVLNAISSSFATTASYALNGGVTQIVAGTNVTINPTSGTGSVTINAAAGAAFPFTGSALITGSLTVTGSISTTSTLNIGNSQFNNTSSVTTAGTTIVSSIATSSFNSAFYNYYIMSASNARAGQIMSVWSGSTVRYTEVTTTDIGNTATASFAIAISGSNINLSLTAPGVWTVKSIANLL